jgi:hypothetical protein
MLSRVPADPQLAAPTSTSGAAVLTCSFLITMPDFSSFLMKNDVRDEVFDEVMS